VSHVLSFIAGGIVFSLIELAILILWAVRGYHWLARGKW
jgi:hypothetical protein